MNGELALGISYFGKLPGSGDFIKSPTNNHQLIQRLDNWAGEALEQLSRNVAWKQLYDMGQPVNFAIMASRKQDVMAGHVLPSTDSSGRRFPFISALTLQAPKPLAFMSRSPLAFARAWARLERTTQEGTSADNPQTVLGELSEDRVNVNVLYETLNPAFQDFLEMQSLASLETLLSSTERPAKVQRILIALGILLQPVMGAGSAGMGKGLMLPLPADPLYRNLVSTFWLDLLAGFLGRADFELLVLVRHDGPPALAVGFNGLQGSTLQAMFDPEAAGNDFIELSDPEWADDHASNDKNLRKLVAYTENSGLSLRTARQTFRETFLGA